MFLSYFRAKVLILVYSNYNSPFCKSLLWGRKETLFERTGNFSYLYLLEASVVNTYDQSCASFCSYLTLSVMAGGSYVFSATLVKLDPMNISFKIIYYAFYILRHEQEFQSRDKWWVVTLPFLIFLFLILLQCYRGFFLSVKPNFIKKYKHVLSGVAETRNEIFKIGSDLGTDFSKIN